MTPPRLEQVRRAGRKPKQRETTVPTQGHAPDGVDWLPPDRTGHRLANMSVVPQWRNHLEFESPPGTEEGIPGVSDPIWSPQRTPADAAATKARGLFQQAETGHEMGWLPLPESMREEPPPVFSEFGPIPVVPAPAGKPGAKARAKKAGVPTWATAELQLELSATILAEAGTNLEQQEYVGWIYVNNVMRTKGLAGLKRSSAYKDKHIWYKIWLCELGDNRYGKESLPTQGFEKRPERTIEEFCKNEKDLTRHAKKVRARVKEMLLSPETNPLQGWTNHGNVNDINGVNTKGKRLKAPRLWDMARAYYWLQMDDPTKKRYVLELPAGRFTQMAFNGDAIDRYFRAHPEELPETVPSYSPPPEPSKSPPPSEIPGPMSTMADSILLTGDTVMFDPVFGLAVLSPLSPLSATLSGTGGRQIDGKAVCVEGDEKNVMVSEVIYTSGSFTIPGKGILKIESLGSDQKATVTKTWGKAVLLKGSTFTARLQITTPAMQQRPIPFLPIPDPTTEYIGTGEFITTNVKEKGR